MNMYTFFDFINYFKTYIEIGILWFIIYQILLFFEGTRAVHVLRGIVVLVVAFLVFQLLGLDRINWLFTKVFAISIIAFLIIFHPEIRQGLAHLGRRHMFGTVLKEEEIDYISREIVEATAHLSANRIGAIIAIEKEITLRPYVESGVSIDGLVSTDLLESIFAPNNLLHDGGVVIQHGRISAAGCLFPLSDNQSISRMFGTRHRAAIGLSEETDAVIIVVSEERGDLSLVYRSKFLQGFTRDDLLLKIKEMMLLRDK
ncbi:MAG: diadenylate cyclase CdaA [Candidatus Omnitrophota bacterium]